MIARLLIAAALALVATDARTQPVPPCAPGVAAVPAPAGLGAEPRVAVWRDVTITGADACLGLEAGPMALVVALAGTFDGQASRETIAARIGAISASRGLPYWSTTERRWRTLIDDTFAVEDAAGRRPRPDFSAEEVLSGRALYFMQDDTRSTGLNLYRMSAAAAPGRLVVGVTNLTTIRFTLLTLFEPAALQTVHIIERTAAGAWAYYGLWAVRAGVVGGYEKSLINRPGWPMACRT